MKFIKIILVLIVVVVLGLVSLYIFGKTGPIASANSERVLRANISILNDINIGVDTNQCKYIGPATLMGTHNPSLECDTQSMFNNTETDKALEGAKKVFEAKGWKGSTENDKYSKKQVMYLKGDLMVSIEPYYWGAGATPDKWTLLVTLSRMTLSNPQEYFLQK